MPTDHRPAGAPAYRSRAQTFIARMPVVVVITAISLIAATCNETRVRVRDESPATRTPAAPRSDPLRIAATGDAVCGEPAGPTPSQCQYAATSDLVVSDDIDAVLMLGDTQYPSGRYGDFLQYYEPTWGRARDKTFPVLGDHEFETASGEPSGYFRYFGEGSRGPDGYGYYSFDLPRGCDPSDGPCWHVIALTSQFCFSNAGCEHPLGDGAVSPGGRQFLWLTSDLESHPGDRYRCTIAFFHHPLFFEDHVFEEVRPLWELLYASGVDIVLNGNTHHYERWRPLTPAGVPDPSIGIRQFIVGTGGSHLEAIEGRADGLVTAQDEAFGVLELDLYAEEYTWRWVPAAGQPTGFTDVSQNPTPCT